MTKSKLKLGKIRKDTCSPRLANYGTGFFPMTMTMTRLGFRKDTCSPRLAKNGTASLPITVTLAALVTNEAATSIPLKNYLDDHPFGNNIWT